MRRVSCAYPIDISAATRSTTAVSRSSIDRWCAALIRRLVFGSTILLGAVDVGVASPPVVAWVEPEEDGKLVYLPIVAETAHDSPTNQIGLHVTMENDGSDEVQLTSLRLVFSTGSAYEFSRDIVIPSGGTHATYLTPDESSSMPLADPAPASVRIELYFAGYGTALTLERDLAPYVAPTQRGDFRFPASESDLTAEQYFSQVNPHSGGAQFFAQDVSLIEWNGSKWSTTRPGGDPSKNEDRVGWNFPIRSMADGVVVWASIGWEDNPAPGTRVIQRMDEAEAGSATELKVTTLSSTRAAAIVRRTDGSFEISAWDCLDAGRQIVPLGTAVGETADLLSMDALKASRLVTAFRTATGTLRVVTWDVSGDGMTITRLGERDALGPLDLALAKLSNSRFVTANRMTDGVLRVIVWDVSSDGLEITLKSQEFAGTATSISLARLSSTRFATSLRDASGRLKVIVWNVLDDGTTIERGGEATDQAITLATAEPASSSRFDTAMRKADGTLRLVRWEVSDGGATVSPHVEAEAGTIQDVALSSSAKSAVITSVITAGGALKHILWKPPEQGGAGEFDRWGEVTGGPTDALDIDQVFKTLHFNGVRTVSGNLKVIAWKVGSGGGNSLFVLTGDCVVDYHHFRYGSVNPSIAQPGVQVSAGQILGRMGNSGTSSGPHTHIGVRGLTSELSVEEVIEIAEQDQLSQFTSFRPMPFRCARAVRKSLLVPGGESTNDFSTMEGQGLYFVKFAVRPKWLENVYVDWRSTCPDPTGELGCPYPTVGEAIATSCCGNLFIRGGSYDESLLIDGTMTVQAYDGDAFVGQ